VREIDGAGNYPPVGARLPVRWDLKIYLALLSLVCVWGVLFALTWAHWGDLTVDCGREMYVPAALAHGRTLYSDVWYPYTPGGPYTNGLLFRLFGIHLGVLYWAGALAALLSSIFLFLTGLELAPPIAGWTTGMVLLIEAFMPSIFNFPLPYSSGAVYGCLSACLCLWLVVKACSSLRPWWMLNAGIAASIALMMKQEMGAACFAALALLVIIRGWKERSFQRVGIDLASLVPGCLLCGAVIYWMTSLKGVEFLTQENLTSWPTSYFMKNYGAAWLAPAGLGFSWKILPKGVAYLSVVAVTWLGLRWIIARFVSLWLLWLSLLALTALIVLSVPYELLARTACRLFFPPAAPFLVAFMTPVAAWLCWRNGFATRYVQILMLFSLAAGMSIRILFTMEPRWHAIYYSGPVILSYLLILSVLLNWKAAGTDSPSQTALRLPYLTTLGAVLVTVLPAYRVGLSQVQLGTERGVVYTTPQKARGYRAVIDFIRQHRQSDASFLSIPEDTSLYFLTGTDCPTRVYVFHPGVLAPGKMTADLIEEIERKQIRYVIWSNRTFKEYGATQFGIDFDQDLGEYIKAVYRPIRPIGDTGGKGWNAVVWERIAKSDLPQRPKS
jgi:hypothetical protein